METEVEVETEVETEVEVETEHQSLYEALALAKYRHPKSGNIIAIVYSSQHYQGFSLYLD